MLDKFLCQCYTKGEDKLRVATYANGEIKMLKFNELPQEVQNQVLQILKAYDGVEVTFKDSNYHLMVASVLKKYYGPDFQFVGLYYAADLYTPEQRDLNYIETFGCEPYPSYTER